MAKYKLECYGWEMEAMALSLTEDRAEDIQQFVEDQGCDHVSEVRNELDEIGIDVYEADIFHFTKPLDNPKLNFRVVNEADEEILAFGLSDMTAADDEIEDFYTKYKHKPFIAYPEKGKIERLLFCVNENKGGLFYMEFESDDDPSISDFLYSGSCIETPEGDWEFIDRIFFEHQELEITDYLDNITKASTTELWTI